MKGRDVLTVMPTGSGKSICYQLPALLLSGVTLVVSPLISLMKDQVSALVQEGISAAFINSSLTASQYREVFRRVSEGKYKLVYVAPERLIMEDFINLAHDVSISMVAVDEAHCVSQWGQDFRPSYLKIIEFIDTFKKRPVIGAFTATATEIVKSDIVKLLKLNNPLSITTGFDRPNLYFDVVWPKYKSTFLIGYIEKRKHNCGIVYCSTRKSVESVCDMLKENRIPATRYHAGLKDSERHTNQEDFVYDRVRVMVATNAFGMGIDKSNVSYVVHYNMPKDIESYYQEAGRAGRDGESAECLLMFSKGDIITAKFLIKNQNPELTEKERARIIERDLARLESMIKYCNITTCLREYILEYFGEKHVGGCENCGNCKTQFISHDITVSAQKILSAVARVERKYTSSLGIVPIMRMLYGSKEKRVIELGLDELSTYGIMKDVQRLNIRKMMDTLIYQNYMCLTDDEYPVLRLNKIAEDVLFKGKHVFMSVAEDENDDIAQDERRIEIKSEKAPVENSLIEILKNVRVKLARENKVPSYIIFSNLSLSDMAEKKPCTIKEFLKVSGVGKFKAERYGESFITAIKEYLENKAES